MESIDKLTELLNFHMRGTETEIGRNWCISVSAISGRGVFSVRDIEAGETIYNEKPLIIGPAGRAESKLNICTVCYKWLDAGTCLCENGCSLPVCNECRGFHVKECELFKLWEPIEPTELNRYRIRAIAIIRGLFLDNAKKEFIYELQANKSPLDKKEIRKISECFRKFPKDEETLNYLQKVVEVLNTNAFEAFNPNDVHETGLRALYPLASIMNHQCTPNTCHIFDGNNTLVCKAAKHIPKGAEIYTTYTKILWSNMTRRLFLNMTKHFNCRCQRCIDPTENGTYISALLCRTKNCFGWIIPANCLSVTSPWRCLECQTMYESSRMRLSLIHI